MAKAPEEQDAGGDRQKYSFCPFNLLKAACEVLHNSPIGDVRRMDVSRDLLDIYPLSPGEGIREFSGIRVMAHLYLGNSVP